jgi:hypothetical protein
MGNIHPDDLVCDRCYKRASEGEHGHMKCPLEARRRSAAIWGDEIPGGLEIANGICNEDGTPKRYYSKTEIRQACAVKGVIPYHDVYTEGGNQTLSDARQYTDYLKSSEAARAKRDRDEMRAEKRQRTH